MAEPSPARYSAEELEAWVAGVCRAFGMSDEDARLAAAGVVDADRSGAGTHGLAGFVQHWHHAPGLADGTVTPRPRLRTLRETPATAAWDADRGYGPVVAARAMDDAADRAVALGVGTVTVRNGCHFGAAGAHARRAARRGLIGMIMTSTPPSAVAPGGREAVVGTNPLAVAVPVAGDDPVVLDMAVTAAAGTKVLHARQRGEAVPAGWIVDADGRPTTDPAQWHALVPLGGDADGGGHKGLALGVIIDLLSGVLSGAGSGRFETFGPDWRVGYWCAAWRIEAFTDPGAFADEAARMAASLRGATPGPDGVRVRLPGDGAAAHRRDADARGVPLDADVVAEAQQWARRTGVAFPAPR